MWIITLDANIKEFGAAAYFPFMDKRQGIVHVIGPENGATLPGMTVVCGDSHTSTHGAFGALAFGIGTSEVSHVLATQCLLQKKPKTFAINVNNVNEGPTGISIRADTLREDVTSGGTIGTANTNAGRPFATLSATDPDSGETFTYSIVGGDSAKYEIVNGNQVQVKAGVSLNYESDNADSITVRVTDSAGNTIDQQFNFNINRWRFFGRMKSRKARCSFPRASGVA